MLLGDVVSRVQRQGQKTVVGEHAARLCNSMDKTTERVRWESEARRSLKTSPADALLTGQVRIPGKQG